MQCKPRRAINANNDANAAESDAGVMHVKTSKYKTVTCFSNHSSPGIDAHGVAVRSAFCTVGAHLCGSNHITLQQAKRHTSWTVLFELLDVGEPVTWVSIARALSRT